MDRKPRSVNYAPSTMLRATTGVHFFDISTAKNGPGLVCFVHVDFKMCFAPQRRATFSTSQLPKVVRTWSVLCILTSKCASRHNGVQLFISHLPRCLRIRRFSEPTFQPSGATKPPKTQCFATFLPFRAPASSFLLTLSLLIFSLLIFLFSLPNLSILSEV